MTITALIVDDEPLAREGIREFLRSERDITIVGECRNGNEAIAAITAKRPDLVFLDIQMPGLSGFDVLDAIQGHEPPAIIFVTAYDEYALRAFQVHALDYLLKPVERERFRAALDRVRAQIEYAEAGALSKRLAKLLDEVKVQPRFRERLMIKTGGKIYFVQAHEIDWIEAAGNYARLHVKGERHLIRETMTALERRLDPDRFVRIHRSTIVNLDRLKEFQPWFKGEHVAIMRDGTRLSVSRKYRTLLEKRLEPPS